MNRIKRFILPVAIVLIGAGAAFATNVAKESDSVLELGYYISSNEVCLPSEGVYCTTTPGVECTWYDSSSSTHHQLFQINGTSCVEKLYQP